MIFARHFQQVGFLLKKFSAPQPWQYKMLLRKRTKASFHSFSTMRALPLRKPSVKARVNISRRYGGYICQKIMALSW